VPVNEVLDVKIPHLSDPYSIQVHGRVREEYPDRYDLLVNSLYEAVHSDEMRRLSDQQDLTPFLRYMSPAECEQFVTDYLNMLAEFKPAMQRDVEEMQ